MGGKLYSYILNKRLTQWIEDNKMLNEAQAGFTQGYSTIDSWLWYRNNSLTMGICMFVLLTLRKRLT